MEQTNTALTSMDFFFPDMTKRIHFDFCILLKLCISGKEYFSNILANCIFFFGNVITLSLSIRKCFKFIRLACFVIFVVVKNGSTANYH